MRMRGEDVAKIALSAAKLPKFLLQKPLEKYDYGSGKYWKTPGIFSLLLCGQPVVADVVFG